MKLKKSLGQNFFANPRLADRIVGTVIESNPKAILEIGPGDGYFTERLVQKVDHMTVIEKDTRLSEDLRVKLPTVTIINEDILETDLTAVGSVSGETVCFGSLPYNISKRIVSRMLAETTIHDLYFIIQKEVADKYALTEGDTSVLSLITKLYADCYVIMDIKPGAFIPAPKVTSSFVKFTRNRNLEKVKDPKVFIALVKAAFSSPRKMLRNNLKGWKVNEEMLTKRPSQLSFDEYVSLANSQ
jgi:16S rRNA (adenine1518-N6/adenine1519-N6)-dimethyltransferase